VLVRRNRKLRQVGGRWQGQTWCNVTRCRRTGRSRGRNASRSYPVDQRHVSTGGTCVRLLTRCIPRGRHRFSVRAGVSRGWHWAVGLKMSHINSHRLTDARVTFSPQWDAVCKRALVTISISWPRQERGYQNADLDVPDSLVHDIEGTEAFTVGKLQGGYIRYFSSWKGLRSGLGMSASAGFVPSDLETEGASTPESACS
jgi:hypothetical protein